MKQDKKIALPKVPKQSKDLVAEKKEQLKKLFPEAFEEDKLSFEELKKTLGEAVASNGERFGLQWSGKAECYQTIQTRSSATLKPNLAKENEQNFLDSASENIFIEGDNLEVLKLLQESYFGKVKMIYIDPPYNTGKEFIYPDNHKDNLKTYLEYTGQLDENGKKFSTNTEQEGRFHSNWLSMMYPRLFLARNLLTEDGVIFISIDDNEQANLKKICDQIFGEDNFVANINIFSNPRGRQSSKHIAETHEYILVYAKNTFILRIEGEKLTEEQKKEYNKEDVKGFYREIGLRKRGAGARKEDSPSLFFPIFYDKNKNKIYLESKKTLIKIEPRLENGNYGRWRWSKKKIIENINLLLVRQVKRDGVLEYDIFEKDYLKEDTKRKIKSSWLEKEINYDRSSKEQREIFDRKVIEYTKPVYVLSKAVKMASNKNEIVLDFFAGSCTTADAVMQLNAEDGGTF